MSLKTHAQPHDQYFTPAYPIKSTEHVIPEKSI